MWKKLTRVRLFIYCFVFAALTNYLTGVNGLGVNDNDDGSVEKSLSKFWPANVHIIGKDILWFHTVIWPCLLMSAGLPLPKTVFAHGFVNDKEGKKMSKSLGNVVDPHDMLDKFHVDTFRWYVPIPSWVAFEPHSNPFPDPHHRRFVFSK